ncbi:MAG: F0F1 ATP synthase subunit B [Erysipelotrichaceae bacterium]
MEGFTINLLPDLLTMGLQLSATLVLFLVIKHYFVDKMAVYIATRGEAIHAELTDAQRKNTESELALKTAEDNLAKSKKEALDIIKVANETATRISETAKAESIKECDDLIQAAKLTIKQEKNKAQSQIKAEVINLTLASTKQLLEKEINDNDHQRFLDEFLSEAERTSWKS